MASSEIRDEYELRKLGATTTTYRYDTAPLMLTPESDRPARRAAVLEWIWEILAMVLSIVGLMLVAIIAGTMNNRPLADWPLTKPDSSVSISINAVVSAVAVFSRATLAAPIIACISQLKWLHFQSAPRKVSDMEIFDNASRGGLGPLQLMFKIPMNGAALGAFITIVAYALGPFYQQVIRLEQWGVDVPGNETSASFGFSHEYITDIKSEVGSLQIDVQTVDTEIHGAMMAMSFGTPIPSNFNCSSICNWVGPFTTLGFQSQCRNVTQATLATKKCSDKLDSSGDFLYESNCTMTTPGNVTLAPTFTIQSYATRYYLSGRLTDRNESEHVPLNPELFRVAQYTVDRNITDATILSEDVQECNISVAAHIYYNIEARGNNLSVGTRTIVSEQLTVAKGPDGGASANEGDRRFIASNITYNAHGLPELKIYEMNLRLLMAFLVEQFTHINVQIGPEEKSNPTGLGFVVATRNNLDASMQAMTERMTQRIANGSSRQLAIGTTNQQVVFVVAWYPMLILPIFVTAATLVLLIFTMWSSRASTGTVLWKASALALLFHHVKPGTDDSGFGPRSGVLHCDYRDPNELERMAKTLTARKID